MSSRFFVRLAFFATLLSAVPNALAQANLTIYTDNLVNGFQDWSWGTHNMANTTPVHSGSASISFSDSAWNAISFENSSFNATLYTNLTFWAHGGTSGGQQLQVYINYGNGSQGTTVALPSTLAAGTWTQYTITLSSLGVATATNINRINIQLTSSGTTGTFYIDDVTLTAKHAPALVHLNVNATQTVRTADARWFGVNTAVWDSYLDSTSTSNALKDIGVGFLRFPGGSESDGYDWQTGTDISGTTWSSTWANFIHVATNAHAQAIITVNYGTGTSNEAAAWVLSANKTNNCGFKYWEIGNECYGSWETDSNSVAHDPYTYAVRAANYISLMKAADPTIKIGVVAVPGEGSYSNNASHFAVNSRTSTTNYGWTPVMLATLKGLGVTPDFLIHHVYPEATPNTTPAPASDSDALVMQSTVNWASDAADLRQQITDYLGAPGAGTEILCTENNSDSGAFGRQLTSVVNGLYIADSMAQLMKTEINGYSWWDLRNGQSSSGSFDATLYGWRTYGDEGLLNGTGSPAVNKYPTYFAFKLMQYFIQGGDSVLNPTSDYLLLPAYAAARTNGTLTVLVINKDVTTSFTAQVNLANFVPNGTVNVRSYGIQQDNVAAVGGADALQDVTNYSISIPGATFTNTFPAGTLTLFTFTSAGSPPAATTLALSSGSNPSTYGNSVTFTATLRTNGVAVGSASGETVTFYNGATQLGTGTLNGSGQAAYATTAAQLAAGTPSITAVYGGDTAYAASTNSPALSQTVNQATLTAGLTGTVSKTYNGTQTATLAAGNYTLSGVVSGDTVKLNNPTSGTYDTRNQGTGKTVSVTGLSISGTSAGNYALSSTSVSGAVGTINKTNLTVTAAANSKTYDGTPGAAATPAITLGGVQTGDNANFTETYNTKTVGTGKTLTPSGSVSDGNSGNNYAVTFANNTSGVIAARSLTETATGVNKSYDGTATATVTLADNRVSGDVFTDSYSGASFNDKNAGNGKTVNVSGIAISGTDAANYTFNTTASTTASISAQAITVTAAANSKTYDGTPGAAATPTVTSGSVRSGDTAGFTETYDTKNAGTGKTLTPSGTVNDGNSGNNYSYTFVATANGTILAATLTNTANPASMTYGAAVPALTGSVSGFVGTDTQGNATTGALSFTTPATSSSGVGSYAINGSGLTANNGNYTFIQAAGNATALTISARPVNLTGTRPYDGTTTASAGILSVANKVGSDTVTVASGSGVLATAEVGSQAISSLGTLALGGAAAGNYTLSGAGGSVNILPLVTPAFAARGISAGSGGWQLNFCAQAGQTYKVLVTDDLTLPLNQWTVLTNGTCGTGMVSIMDVSTNLPFRFYRIVSP
ncbi:MAG: beta strand repeat-containing protein [Limisphaerales bacterium]